MREFKKLFSILLVVTMLLSCQICFAWTEAEDSANADIVRIGVLSDTHVSMTGSASELTNMMNTFYDIDSSMDGFIFTGDIVLMTDYTWNKATGENAEAVELANLKEVYGTIYDRVLNATIDAGGTNKTIEEILGEGKLAFAMGNHEVPWGISEEGAKVVMIAARSLFTEATGLAPEHTKTLGGIPVVTLGADDYDGNFGEDKLKYLVDEVENALALTTGPVLINVHQGFENTFYGTETKETFNYAKYTFPQEGNYVERLEAIKKNPRVIAISAHTHIPLQHPKAIYQQAGGFTAVQTSHISNGNAVSGADVNPENTYENKVSQGLIIEYNKTTNKVLIRKIDSKNGCEIGSPWEIDLTGRVQQYTNEARESVAQAPVFENSTELDIKDITTSGATVVFDRATSFSESETDFAYFYEVKLINKEEYTVVSTKTYLSDYFKSAQKDVQELTITGLDSGTEYIVRVTAVSPLLKKSPYIEGTFTTARVTGFADEQQKGVLPADSPDLSSTGAQYASCNTLTYSDYIKYSFDITTAGTYRIITSCGSNANAENITSSVSLYIDGVERFSKFVPLGWGESNELVWGDVYLDAKAHEFKVVKTGLGHTGSVTVTYTKIARLLGVSDDDTFDETETIDMEYNLLDEDHCTFNRFETSADHRGSNAFLTNESHYVEYTVDVSGGIYQIWMNYGVYTADKTAHAKVTIDGEAQPEILLDYNGYYWAPSSGDDMYGALLATKYLSKGTHKIKITKVYHSTDATYFTTDKIKIAPLRTPLVELYNDEFVDESKKTDEIKDGFMTVKAMVPSYMQGEDISLILAIYKDNRLYKVSLANETVSKSGVVVTTLKDIEKDASAKYTYKVMFFNGLGELKPLYVPFQ